jgi:hypothetical protein
MALINTAVETTSVGVNIDPFKTERFVMIAHLMRIALMVWIVASFLGCSRGTDFEVPQADNIPNGPGVFTKGNDGAVLYDSKGGNIIQPAPQPTAAQQTASETTTSQTTAFEEYEAYRQWKHWKNNPQNAEAYQEFLEWREWNRYRQWKDKQPAQP